MKNKQDWEGKMRNQESRNWRFQSISTILILATFCWAHLISRRWRCLSVWRWSENKDARLGQSPASGSKKERCLFPWLSFRTLKFERQSVQYKLREGFPPYHLTSKRHLLESTTRQESMDTVHMGTDCGHQEGVLPHSK